MSLHITIHFSRPRCFADFLVQFSSFIIGYKSVNFENISITENKILDWEKCVKCEDFYSRKIYINCKNQSTLRILIEGCFQNETPQINEGRLYTYFLQSWSQKPKRHVGTCSQPTFYKCMYPIASYRLLYLLVRVSPENVWPYFWVVATSLPLINIYHKNSLLGGALNKGAVFLWGIRYPITYWDTFIPESTLTRFGSRRETQVSGLVQIRIPLKANKSFSCFELLFAI